MTRTNQGEGNPRLVRQNPCKLNRAAKAKSQECQGRAQMRAALIRRHPAAAATSHNARNPAPRVQTLTLTTHVETAASLGGQSPKLKAPNLHKTYPVAIVASRGMRCPMPAKMALVAQHLARTTVGQSKPHQGQKVCFPIRSFPVLVAKNPFVQKRAGAPKSQKRRSPTQVSQTLTKKHLGVTGKAPSSQNLGQEAQNQRSCTHAMTRTNQGAGNPRLVRQNPCKLNHAAKAKSQDCQGRAQMRAALIRRHPAAAATSHNARNPAPRVQTLTLTTHVETAASLGGQSPKLKAPNLHKTYPVAIVASRGMRCPMPAKMALVAQHLARTTVGQSKPHQGQKVCFPIRSCRALVAKNPFVQKPATVGKSQKCWSPTQVSQSPIEHIL